MLLLCACLVGCGDDVSNATANASASKAVERVEAYSSKEDPLAAPTLFIDGENAVSPWDVLSFLRISGERTVEFEYPDDLVTLIPIENTDFLQPGESGSSVIKPGERKGMLWRRKSDHPSMRRQFIVSSYTPAVYVVDMTAKGLKGGGTVSSLSGTQRENPHIGNVLYWEEHRSQSNQLVGFDLAFECADQELVILLPGFMPSGYVQWKPFACSVDPSCGELLSYSHKHPNLTSYCNINEESGAGIVKPDESPECTIKITDHDGTAVVRISMRCWPNPMPYELMFVEFMPSALLEEGEISVNHNIHVYLPKSPFKAEGFELSEFQEAAQSE